MRFTHSCEVDTAQISSSSSITTSISSFAEVIRLNAHGWYVEKIADHFNWTAQTMREVLHRWEKLGLDGLWEKQGVEGNRSGQKLTARNHA